MTIISKIEDPVVVNNNPAVKVWKVTTDEGVFRIALPTSTTAPQLDAELLKKLKRL